MSENVLIEVHDKVATITLNRPEKLNAFTDEMLQNLVKTIDECEMNDNVRAVVLTGGGRGFSAGGDVTAMGNDADNAAMSTKKHVTEAIQAFPRRMASFDKPIIAAVNGVAAGGGMDLALACDIRTAGKSAKFIESYAKIGLLPGGGGAYFLPRIVGTARALELLLTADLIDAEQALQIGLVNHVFEDAELLTQTQALAGRMAALPPYSVTKIKRTVYQSLQTDIHTALELVGSHIATAKSSADHLEAIAAFREKRPGDYKGR